MPVVQQLTVAAANRPGTLARLCEVLAAARINISGLNASGASRQIRLVVSSAGKARRALAKARIRARVENVVAVSLPNRPGSLARAARKLAKRKININYAYATVSRGGGRATIVFGVGNPGRAARVVG